MLPKSLVFWKVADDTATKPGASISRRGRVRNAVAGFTAVAAALGAGELVSGVSGATASPLVAVGDAIIDLAPNPVVLAAVSTLQHLSKPVLLAGIAVLALATGAALGVIADRSTAVAAGGMVLGGMIYLLAIVGRPQVSPPTAVLSATVTTVAGVAVLLLLIKTVRRQQPATASASPRTLERRRFIVASGLTLLAAAGANIAGRALARRPPAGASAHGAALPSVRRPLPPLPATVTFEIPGISPFLTPNDEFYRVDVALTVPHVDVERWRLRLTGMVGRPVELTYQELVGLPLVESDVTLCCVSNEVGGDLVGTARWTGVLLGDLVRAATVRPDASQVIGRAVDGWTAGFQTTAALEAGALVAVGMNGVPLPPEHGFPARLVVPGRYGYVSATKWLEELEFTTWEAADGYWVQRGWDKEGQVETQARIDSPRWGASLPAGPVDVAGVAWAPPVGVTAVEVQIDDRPWAVARLGDEASPHAWRSWVFRWNATAGEHLVQARATNGNADTQTAQVRRPEPQGATGYHGVKVEIR